MQSWLFLAPEGTFFDRVYPKVLEKSRNYCRENGYKIFNHVLMPKTRALNTISQHFRDKFEAIFDITIIYPNTRSNDGMRKSSPSIMGEDNQLFYFMFRKKIAKEGF